MRHYLENEYRNANSEGTWRGDLVETCTLEFTKRSCDWIPDGARVLDLGTGDGAFLERVVRAQARRGRRRGKESRLGRRLHPARVGRASRQHCRGFGSIWRSVLRLRAVARHVSGIDFARRRFSGKPFASEATLSSPTATSPITACGCRSLFRGRTPITKSLPQPWYRTTNLHFLSLLDFRDFCRQMSVSSIRDAFFSARGEVVILPNLFAEEIVTLLEPSPDKTGNQLLA